MKAVFLSYNQALTDRVNAILDEQGIRGFTKWGLDRGPRLGRRRTPLRHACVAFDERLDPGHRRRREGGSADGRLPRVGRCDQDAGVPGVCLEHRKRFLILTGIFCPALSGRTGHTRRISRPGRTALWPSLLRDNQKPDAACPGIFARCVALSEIETCVAMRCEK